MHDSIQEHADTWVVNCNKSFNYTLICTRYFSVLTIARADGGGANGQGSHDVTC